jgi:transposase
MPGDTQRRYPPELKERAVRMVADMRADHESKWAAINQGVRATWGRQAETVRKWVRQDQVDSGTRAGTSTEDSAEVRRLKRENAELRRANGILKAAAAFFGAELEAALPPIVQDQCMVHGIDDHDRFMVATVTSTVTSN